MLLMLTRKKGQDQDQQPHVLHPYQVLFVLYLLLEAALGSPRAGSPKALLNNGLNCWSQSWKICHPVKGLKCSQCPKTGPNMDFSVCVPPRTLNKRGHLSFQPHPDHRIMRPGSSFTNLSPASQLVGVTVLLYIM